MYLLIGGYALGGSSYATPGWAIKEALPDQVAVLNKFQQLVGAPHKTIAWGLSMGGIITGGLIQQYPDRFQGAMPVCGVMGGGCRLLERDPGLGIRSFRRCWLLMLVCSWSISRIQQPT